MSTAMTSQRCGAGLLVALLSLAACGGWSEVPTVADGDTTASTTTNTNVTTGADTSSANTASTSTPDPASATSTTVAPTTGPSAAASTGTLQVRLAPVEGIFIEGFEVGLRFETSDGEVLYSGLWTEYVRSLDDDSIEAYYESVLTQAVPAGDVVVLATANVGIGPGPVIPDPDGVLDCRVVVSVPAGGETTVEVSFTGDRDCLAQV